MTVDEILELAHQAGITFVTQQGVASATAEWLESFAALIEQSVIKRLSAGAGEPIGEAHLCDECDAPFDGSFYCPECRNNTAIQKPIYSQEQVAAAVAAETERCAKVCEETTVGIDMSENEYVVAKNGSWKQCAAAIRGRTV